MIQLLGEAGRRPANRRRLLQGGAALGLAAAGLTGVNRSGVNAQDVTTLAFSHDKQPWQDFFIAQGDLAEAAINVNWEPTPYSDTTVYQAALLPALPTDDTPDFFTWWSGFRIEELYKENVLEDLTDVWTQAVADGNLPESLAAAFTFDGKQIAIPSHVSYWVVFYNKPVFEANGLTPPTTWDELIAAADTLKAAGVIPFGATVVGRWPSFIWFEEMVLRTDPAFYEALTLGQAKYTDPTAVQAMETWKGLIEAEYFNSFDIDLFTEVPGMFANGEIAMIPVGTWYQSNFLTAGMTPGEDYDLFIMPNINSAITDKVAIVETGALAVGVNSDQVEAAKQMAAWWVTPEAQTAWCNRLGDAPANPTATSDNPVLNNLLGKLNDEGYKLYQRYWEASPVPIVEGAVDYLAEFMLNPDDYMSVLENIQELADGVWAEREA
jgi:multiple sugar transport system substrate-binding protein